jgi:hypothetical protein
MWGVRADVECCRNAGAVGSGFCRNGLKINLNMAREIKRIQVKDQQQAAVIINRLSQQYEMKSDTTRHQFHVSNGRYAAYYDVEEGVVKMEAIHPGVTEEEIKEFLMEFPPFF